MRTIRYFGLAARVGLGMLGWQSALQAKVELGVVATTATPVPGTGDGHISDFSNVYLAENGNLAWFSNVKGTGLAGLSLWRDVGKGPEVLFLDGTKLDGIDGDVLISTNWSGGGVPGPFIDEDGNVTLRVWTGGVTALITGTADDFQIIALTGTAAPGVDGATFYDFQGFYPSAGEILFEATVTGATANDKEDGLWIWKNGKAKLVMLTGDPAPGFSGQFFDKAAKPRVTALNENGRFVFAARRTGDAAVTRDGLWTGTGADDLELTYKLDPPREEGAVAFDLKSMGQYIHQITPDDQLLVASSVNFRTGGLWLVSEQQAELLLGTGTAVPGRDGYKFVELPIWGADDLDGSPQPSFSPSGRYAFGASISNGNKDAFGVWSGDAAGARTIVLNDAPYPGVDDITPHYFGRIETNDNGQVMVDSTGYVGDSTSERHVLVRYIPSEGFEKVLIADDTITDENDDERVVTEFRVPCADNAEFAQLGTSCQDASGRIVVEATLADGAHALVLTDEPARGKPEKPESTTSSGSGGSAGSGTGGTSSGTSGGAGESSTQGGSGGSTSKGGSGGSAPSTSKGGSSGTAGSTSKGGSTSSGDAGDGNDGKAPAAAQSTKEDSGCSVAAHGERSQSAAALFAALALALVSRRSKVGART